MTKSMSWLTVCWLLVSAVVAVAAAGDARVETAASIENDASQLRGAKTSETTHRRSLQASTNANAVGTISKLRWINTDTDMPFKVNGNEYISPRGGSNLGPYTIDSLDYPTVPFTLEAIVDPNSGPVTKVKFETFNFARTEFAAPYAMCGNKGADYFACNKTGEINVTPYNSKGVAGIPSNFWLLVIFVGPPRLFFDLVNADTDALIASTVDTNETPFPTINVTQTPNINVVLRYRETLEKFTYDKPHSVDFDYDNGKYTRFDTVEPFCLAANAGNDYFAMPPTLLTPGNHTIKATVYRRANRVGPSVVRTQLNIVV